MATEFGEVAEPRRAAFAPAWLVVGWNGGMRWARMREQKIYFHAQENQALGTCHGAERTALLKGVPPLLDASAP